MEEDDISSFREYLEETRDDNKWTKERYLSEIIEAQNYRSLYWCHDPDNLFPEVDEYLRKTRVTDLGDLRKIRLTLMKKRRMSISRRTFDKYKEEIHKLKIGAFTKENSKVKTAILRTLGLEDKKEIKNFNLASYNNQIRNTLLAA